MFVHLQSIDRCSSESQRKTNLWHMKLCSCMLLSRPHLEVFPSEISASDSLSESMSSFYSNNHINQDITSQYIFGRDRIWRSDIKGNVHACRGVHVHRWTELSQIPCVWVHLRDNFVPYRRCFLLARLVHSWFVSLTSPWCISDSSYADVMCAHTTTFRIEKGRVWVQMSTLHRHVCCVSKHKAQKPKKKKSQSQKFWKVQKNKKNFKKKKKKQSHKKTVTKNFTAHPYL